MNIVKIGFYLQYSEWNYVNYGNKDEMDNYVTTAVESQFKQLRSSPKKVFRGFNGIRTRGLCVRAAVLYQLSYEDPYTGTRPIYQHVKGMKHIHFIYKILSASFIRYIRD